MVSKLMNPLNGDQMLAAIPNAKLITYHDLKRRRKIDRVVSTTKPVILLYPQFETATTITGHWVCLFRNSQGLNYFDSYGYKPDAFWKKDPKLVKLLQTCKGPMEYNEHCYQGKDTEVCGRYVIFRLMKQDKTNEEFRSMMNLLKQGWGSYDKGIVAVTSE